ncbi:MAG: SDR family oxidoreductase [Acidobacteriota bacterium]
MHPLEVHAAAPLGRVVVIGAGGFVGRTVVSQLSGTGVELVALGSRDADLSSPAAVGILQDRLRADDAVVFVSALTPDRGKDIATLMNNLAMGAHVCAALSARRPSHVVYISSDAVYEERAALVNESTPCDPPSFHGTMHRVRERMLIEQLGAAGVPLAVLRPSLLYGAEDTHNGYGPNRFFRTAIKDKKITLFGGGEEQRDHVAVEDLASIVAATLRTRATGVLNVATGASRSFGDIARLIARLVGDGVQIEERPRASAITHRHFDPTAMLRAFPEFRPMPLEAGLGRMADRLGVHP